MWVSLLLIVFAICMVFLGGNNAEAEQLYYDVEDAVYDTVPGEGASEGSVDGSHPVTDGVPQTPDTYSRAEGPGVNAGAGDSSAYAMAQDIYDSIDF